MKKLKLFNGRDWECRGGHLYVAAYSVRDAAELSSAAYRKTIGLEDRLDIVKTSISEVNVYWHKGCWGSSMEGINPERGVWWVRKNYGQGTVEEKTPMRIL